MIVPTRAKVGIVGFFNNHKPEPRSGSVEQFSKLFPPYVSNSSALALISKTRSVASFDEEESFFADASSVRHD